MGYTVENRRQVWNDEDGWRYEIGPASDSLGLVQVRYVELDGKVSADLIVVDPDCAELIAKAMLECVRELREAGND